MIGLTIARDKKERHLSETVGTIDRRKWDEDGAFCCSAKFGIKIYNP